MQEGKILLKHFTVDPYYFKKGWFYRYYNQIERSHHKKWFMEIIYIFNIFNCIWNYSQQIIKLKLIKLIKELDFVYVYIK